MAYIHCLKKCSQLLALCNFVKSQQIIKNFAVLETLWNLLQNPYDTTHLTLDTLLHYLGKAKIQISADIQQTWKKVQTNCILSASILIPLYV